MRQKLFILWLMLLVGASGLRAEEAYTYFDPSDGSLNFCYDNYKSNRGNQGFTTYDLNTGSNNPGWHNDRTTVKKVVISSSFANARPTSCRSWFSGMWNLTSITGLEYLNTSQVTDMVAMFLECPLESIDVSHFDTSNVEAMGGMFEDCENLKSIDLSSFNTSNVNDKLLGFISMFYGCSSLTSLDLSTFTFSSSNPNSGRMFNDCSALKQLIVPATASRLNSNACSGVGTQTAPCALIYPDGFNLQKTAEGDGWYQWKSGYFSDAEAYAFLSSDKKTLTFYYDTERSARTGTVYELNQKGHNPGWYDDRTSVENVVFAPSFANARPTSCRNWFVMVNLKSITGLEYLNTSKVTEMVQMFMGCPLESIDVSHFNTEWVRAMGGMFYLCENLKSVNLSSFDTRHVDDVNLGFTSMFYGCSSLTSLDLSTFTFSSNAASSTLCYGCSALQKLIVPATAYNLNSNACFGIGTQTNPCTLVYPDGFTPEKSAEGNGWYLWKYGFFKDEIKPYAVLSTDKKTLTFYYDSEWSTRTGNVYELNTGSNNPGWHDDRTSVKKVVISSSFANARPTSCRSWFALPYLESITGLEYLNTSEVTDMVQMFMVCPLESIDVSHFNTAKVRAMGGMFYLCENLKSVNLSSFDTSNVDDVNLGFISMFYGCSSLTSLDLSTFTFSSSAASSTLFYDCSALQELIVPATANNLNSNACLGLGSQTAPCTLIYPSGFTPEKTSEGDGWYMWKDGYFKDAEPEPYAVLSTDKKTLTFYYDNHKGLLTGTTYDLNTGSERPGWFDYNSPVTNVVFDSSFADARPTSCKSWFYQMTNLTSITGIEYLNTSNVTNMASMFAVCKRLSNINVSHFNTAQVKDMSAMFEQCSFTSIDVSNFDTSNVTNMVGMFYNNKSLETLDISNFVIPDSTNFYGNGTQLVFVDCQNLKTLILPSTAYNFKYGTCTRVGTQSAPCTLIYPADFTPEKTSEGDGWYMWKGGYFKDGIKPYAVVDGSTLTFYYDDQYSSRTGEVYDLNEGSNAPGWNSRASSITQVNFSSSFNDARPTSCYRWFSGMSNMVHFKIFRGSFKTDNVTDMSYMFEGCSSLEDIDFDYMNVDNLTNMSHMFAGCSKLKTIKDATSLRTSNVTDMSYMFESCSSLENINISFRTSNVTNMSHMFKGCSSLRLLGLGYQFRTSNVTDMAYMFADCSSIASLDLSDFTFNSGAEMTGLLNNCSGLKVLIIPSTASNLPSGACDGVGTKSAPCSLDFPDGFTLNPTATGDGWFQWKSGYFTDFMQYAVLDGSTLTFYYDNLKKQKNQGYVYDVKMSEDYPGWWTGWWTSSSVTSVVFDHSYAHARPLSCWGWFCDMNNLQSIIGIENLNTDEVKYMGRMFQDCSSLTNLDVSGFNTGNVIDMAFMFKGCSSLTSLDVSGFDTGKVEEMERMFAGCTGLTSLDLSHFNTEKVDIFNEMFYECSSLKNLDLGNFNFSVKESTGWYDRHYRLLYGCSALQTLTIPATANLWDSNACDGVGSQSAPCTLIYPSDFTPEKTSEGDGWYQWKSGYFKDYGPEPYAVLSSDQKTLTFYYDKNRATRTGTSYDLNTGTENPGWYDKRASITKVIVNVNFADARPTTCYRWFAGTKTKTVTNFRYINTSQVTNMACMFSGCTNLESLDLAKINTAGVTTMEQMFNGCTKLTTLDLSKFNTSKVTNVSRMFDGCTGLTALDLSKFDFSKVSTAANSSAMMRNCSSLQELTIPSTANKLGSFVCTGIGTKTAPCTLVYPAGFNVVKSETGDGWYVWKGGYFKDKMLFPLGDVNHDGYITVVDASLAVDYVMGNNPPVFFIENADMNSDGSITITDVSKIVDIVLNGSASHAPATAREATMDRMWLNANGGHCLLHLDTPERYTAMHITLRLPDGASMGNIRLSSSRSAGHSIGSRAIGDGLYNIVLYASNNSELRSDDTALLHFDIAGCQPRDVEVVAVQSTNRLFETIMSSGITTGIDIVETDDATDGDSYNTVGVRVGKNARGVVIKNGSKRVKKD